MKPPTDTAVPADATREKPQPAPVTQQCGDTKRGAVVDWVCTKEHGHKGAHTDGSASWFDDRAYLQIQHARKQGDADGFQKGWHAALTRIREGDSTDELIALVPAPATVTPDRFEVAGSINRESLDPGCSPKRTLPAAPSPVTPDLLNDVRAFLAFISTGTVIDVEDAEKATRLAVAIEQLRAHRDARLAATNEDGPFFRRDLARLLGLDDDASCDVIHAEVKARMVTIAGLTMKEGLLQKDTEARLAAIVQTLRGVANSVRRTGWGSDADLIEQLCDQLAALQSMTAEKKEVP